MIPALIVAGIIFFTATVFEFIAIFKARKKFCYTIQTHKIEMKKIR